MPTLSARPSPPPAWCPASVRVPAICLYLRVSVCPFRLRSPRPVCLLLNLTADMTIEACVTKLAHLLADRASSTDRIRALLASPLRGEISYPDGDRRNIQQTAKASN
eukprot:SAG22_NODE_4796_length_1161_cov_1.047081_1_plen_107_part_00